MTTQTCLKQNVGSSATLQSQDIVAGLGAAPRDLLATCLALFESSTLQRHLSERVDELKKNLSANPAADSAPAAALSSLQESLTCWKRAPVADDELRLVLWMRLREAFELPPLTFGALRSARTASDDLVAATLNAIKASPFEKARDFAGIGKQREIPGSLDALARQTLAELVGKIMQSDDAANVAVREALVREMKDRVSQLDQESHDKLLSAINARELNDDAIRTILLTGGGLATFGGAVGMAGFSAYILAAQVSAFIPLVSGPALVSFVAVLSNPITIVLATAGAGWWAARSANQKIQAAIAMRVISLLALNGIAASDVGLRQMTLAFARLPTTRNAGTLDSAVLIKYQADWALIAPAHRRTVKPPEKTTAAFARPLSRNDSSDRWHGFMRKDQGAMQDMAAMSALTLGELIYNIHALDPSVLAAADFSRVDDLSNPVAFAAFAHTIESMANSSQLGAISNLKGYVAERVVASQLIEQGHVVEFPELSNEPGWDIAVDGVKLQVKNAADLALIERHFDKGYEYPVLANAEIAEMLAKASELGQAPVWADQVHFVEGYSQQAVQQITDQTLDAGDAMLHPHIPIFAVTLSAIRQFNRYNKDQVTGSQAIQEVMLNGTVAAGLAVVGNYAGVAIGLLVFGPAGALVLGSTLPILSRSQVNRAKEGLHWLTKGERAKNWEAETRTCLRELIAVLQAKLAEKVAFITQRRTRQESNLVADYLRWRLDDDVRFLEEASLKLKHIHDDKNLSVEEAGERLLVWLSTCTLYSAAYQKEFRHWLVALAQRPTLGQNVDDVTKPIIETITSFIHGFRFASKERKAKKKT